MKKFLAVACLVVFASVAGFSADAPAKDAKKEVKKEAKKDAKKAKKNAKVKGC